MPLVKKTAFSACCSWILAAFNGQEPRGNCQQRKLCLYCFQDAPSKAIPCRKVPTWQE